MKNIFLLITILLLNLAFFSMNQSVYAISEIKTRPSTPHPPYDAKQQPVPKGDCGAGCENCIGPCRATIENNHKKMRKHVSDELVKHRKWMVNTYWKKHILPAMMMMTSQLSTGAIQQTLMVGAFFDAKHQLETQRIFQKLMAEAHRDYMPSEGVCEIGTATRSLATSQRKSDLAHMTLSNRMMDRLLRTGGTMAAKASNGDIDSRLNNFIQYHCNKNDNGKGLNWLCTKGGNKKEQMNKDVDFTRTVESRLTLNVDFGKDKESNITADEIDLFALSANLFGNQVFPQIPKTILAENQTGKPRREAFRYLDLRSVAAKRSVAQNSFSAIVGQRVSGDKEAAPFLKKIVNELGIPEPEVKEILGQDPSYFAQMEVLTKSIYQNPIFYTELYDKPANVLRKGVALRSIALMQERDLYESQLRSEATLAVILETLLNPEHKKVSKDLSDIDGNEQAVFK